MLKIQLSLHFGRVICRAMVRLKAHSSSSLECCIMGLSFEGVGMSIEPLREFSYLAETLSFSITAKHFYLSTSVLSKRIAVIEADLGVRLFERDRRRWAQAIPSGSATTHSSSATATTILVGNAPNSSFSEGTTPSCRIPTACTVTGSPTA